MNWLLSYQSVILLGLMAAGFGVGGWLIFQMQKKLKTLFGGENPASSIDLQKDLLRRITRAEARLEEIGPRLNTVEKISKISVQKVGFLRFNPFDDTGGDNSFALALLDREDNGVVISSLYMREGMRAYAKKIAHGTSAHPLSKEETRALEEALGKK